MTTTRLLLAALTASPALLSAAGLSPDLDFRPPSFTQLAPAQRTLLLPNGTFFLFFEMNTATGQRTGPINRYLANGTLDTAFSFSRNYKSVSAAAPGSNGKIYVAARKYIYGIPQPDEVLCLNADGSIDPAFHSLPPDPLYSTPAIRQIRVQPDGKLIVAGYFFRYGSETRRSVVRLLTNGDIDQSFTSVVPSGEIWDVALQTDGKILLAGDFLTVNNQSRLGLARLNGDGTLDQTFQPNGYARLGSPFVRALAIQPDGQILAAGRFRPLSPGSGFAVLRLSATGDFDQTFIRSIPTTSPSGRGLALQADGKILATVNSSLYRLNTDGSIDDSFHLPATINAITSIPPSAGTAISVSLRGDGHILLGGIFNEVDSSDLQSVNHFAVALLNSDGTLDPAFSTPRQTGLDSAFTSAARLGDGSTLITFATGYAPTNPTLAFKLGRLGTNGAIDSSFSLSSQDPNSFLLGDFRATGLIPSGDGNFFVAGITSDGFGVIGKFRANGMQDDTFSSSVYGDFEFAIMGLNGKLLLGAGDDPQATLFAPLVQMQSDGAYDSTFALDPAVRSQQVIRFPDGTLDSIYAGSWPLAAQRDGKTIYHYLDRSLQTHLVRLNANGSFDATFSNITTPAHNVVFSYPYVFDAYTWSTYQPPDGGYTASPDFLDALVESDGRIILATEAPGPGSGLVRLMPDGSVDPSFNIGAGAQWTTTSSLPTAYPNVERVARQSDGRLLITGTFEAFAGVPAPGIASLNSDGSVDASFVAPAQRDRFATGKSHLQRQPDGSYLLSGPYSLPNESSAPGLIHIFGAPAVANISTRLAVGTGDNVLIGGFIITGNTPKNVILRAIGPSLNVNGVPVAGRLLDPVIELHGNNFVLTNDDWRATQEQEIIRSGIAPADDHEAAIVAVLEPGAYTAIVRGANDTSGVGLVEVYDLGQPNALSGQSAQLANISTRGFVQTGDNVMIGGLIVIGAPTRVIVRAIGPDLSNRGVAGALQDPMIELYDANGLVASNDDWRSTQEQEILATHLQPNDNRESAIVATLLPGGYTAIVRGKNGSIGVGLVEAYSLP